MNCLSEYECNNIPYMKLEFYFPHIKLLTRLVKFHSYCYLSLTQFIQPVEFPFPLLIPTSVSFPDCFKAIIISLLKRVIFSFINICLLLKMFKHRRGVFGISFSVCLHVIHQTNVRQGRKHQSITYFNHCIRNK